MRHDRRRTALTMLGMAWGIATVVLLLAYGAGFGRAIETIFANWGTRIIGVFPGPHLAAGRRAEGRHADQVHHRRPRSHCERGPAGASHHAEVDKRARATRRSHLRPTHPGRPSQHVPHPGVKSRRRPTASTRMTSCHARASRSSARRPRSSSSPANTRWASTSALTASATRDGRADAAHAGRRRQR